MQWMERLSLWGLRAQGERWGWEGGAVVNRTTPDPPPPNVSPPPPLSAPPASSLYSSSHSAAGPLISPISPQPLAPARVAPLLRLTYTWKQGLAGFLAPASVVGDFK